MSRVTEKVAKYVMEKGINLAKLSRETKIPYQSLYVSLTENSRGRELRADEFLRICRFLDVDPMRFWDAENEPEKEADNS